jgi:phage tail-like protein
MSCGGATATFRLLDHLVGWELAPGATGAQGLVGFDDPDGVTLAPLDPGRVGSVSPWLPPPWLAPGCGPCAWFLAAPAGGTTVGSVLLQLDACACAWQPVWAAGCTPLPHAEISALAGDGRRLAIADYASGTILLFTDGGDRQLARIACADVVAMTFAPRRVLLVATQGSRQLRRFDLAGTPLESFEPAIPADATAGMRLGVGRDGAVWLAMPASDGTYAVWRAQPGDPGFTTQSLADLAAARPATRLLSDADNGFCITRNKADGEPVSCCYGRDGKPLADGTAIVSATPRYQTQGQLLTGALDSGVPRCVWHRVRVDADVPVGTQLSIAVATADLANPPSQGQPDAAPWNQFPAGVPHPLDWQAAPSGASDFLIRQPPGRFLHLRLRLRSTDGGITTPRVRRLRIEFPRVTSLESLPAIYRDNPEAADFTERFLALFDASIADLDTAIARAPALLDSGGVPDDVLPWLAAFLGVALDPAWEAARSRAILQAVPELYRRRGTLAGLKLAFKLVFDVEPAIEEMALQRAWAALGPGSQLGARLGTVRLFGRSRARAIVGQSALGATTLKSYGNPAADPLDATAYRFRVLVPPRDCRSS